MFGRKDSRERDNAGDRGKAVRSSSLQPAFGRAHASKQPAQCSGERTIGIERIYRRNKDKWSRVVAMLQQLKPLISSI